MFNEELFQQRLSNFSPEPLSPKTNMDNEVIHDSMIAEDINNMDLAKTNYLNFLNNAEIKKTAEDVIRHYGVGTCGPRCFYGTTDVHIEAEKCLSKFLQMEDCLIYANGIVAVSSSIMAYCKKNDVVFVDEKTNLPIRQGLEATLSKVVEFSHNDPNDFKKKVQKFVASERKNSTILIIEGISWNTGKLCPLPDFISIAEEFKVRIFLEESYTLGIFGDYGRGLTEYYNIDTSKLDLIFGTLEGAIGSPVGFCAGGFKSILYHQLTGTGFLFSCSAPTYLVKVVQKSIELIGNSPQRFSQLAKMVHKFLEEDCKFNVQSHPEAPFKLITINPKTNETKVHQYCKENGVYFIQNENGLMINLNVKLLEERDQLNRLFQVFKRASDLIK